MSEADEVSTADLAAASDVLDVVQTVEYQNQTFPVSRTYSQVDSRAEVAEFGFQQIENQCAVFGHEFSGAACIHCGLVDM
jgi:hypothetical protein